MLPLNSVVTVPAVLVRFNARAEPSAVVAVLPVTVMKTVLAVEPATLKETALVFAESVMLLPVRLSVVGPEAENSIPCAAESLMVRR